MRKFEIGDRVVLLLGQHAGHAGSVTGMARGCDDDGNVWVKLDVADKWLTLQCCDSLAAEPTDGTVLPQHRAMSSGALKGGWR